MLWSRQPCRAHVNVCFWFIVVRQLIQSLCPGRADASLLFMADAPQSRPLSWAHTWSLWDEVTTLVLACTSQTVGNSLVPPLTFTLTSQSNLVHMTGHFYNHKLLGYLFTILVIIYSHITFVYFISTLLSPSLSHPCPAYPAPSSPSPSPLFSLFIHACYCTDWFNPVQHS